jgi:N-acetylglucosaminyl-diphospho-decaprenol L-rhamnosyltransferase
MGPSLDIIIVNWNTGAYLRDCLAALSGTQRDGYVLGRVVVVDNASSDHSADDLFYPTLPLSIIRNNSNRGFAAACNQGAEDSMADYLLFLNPDTSVLNDTLSKSVAWMEAPGNSRTGVSGVQLLDENGNVSRSCSRGFKTRYFIYHMLGLSRIFLNTFPDYVYLEWDHLESRHIEHVIGAYLFIRRLLFEEVKGFDERFFVYCEDVDLTLKVRQAGWSIYYLSTAQCHHAGCGSSRQTKARRLFYTLRSRIFYGFKNFGTASAVTLLLATLFIEPISRIGDAMVRGSMTEFLEIVHAYVSLWRALPGILGSQYLRQPETMRLEVEGWQ